MGMAGRQAQGAGEEVGGCGVRPGDIRPERHPLLGRATQPVGAGRRTANLVIIEAPSRPRPLPMQRRRPRRRRVLPRLPPPLHAPPGPRASTTLRLARSNGRLPTPMSRTAHPPLNRRNLGTGRFSAGPLGTVVPLALHAEAAEHWERAGRKSFSLRSSLFPRRSQRSIFADLRQGFESAFNEPGAGGR